MCFQLWFQSLQYWVKAGCGIRVRHRFPLPGVTHTLRNHFVSRPRGDYHMSHLLLLTFIWTVCCTLPLSKRLQNNHYQFLCLNIAFHSNLVCRTLNAVAINTLLHLNIIAKPLQYFPIPMQSYFHMILCMVKIFSPFIYETNFNLKEGSRH